MDVVTLSRPPPPVQLATPELRPSRGCFEREFETFKAEHCVLKSPPTESRPGFVGPTAALWTYGAVNYRSASHLLLLQKVQSFIHTYVVGSADSGNGASSAHAALAAATAYTSYRRIP